MHDRNVSCFLVRSISLFIALICYNLQEKVGRCFIEAWSVTEELIKDFKMPFIRRNGEYEIKFIKCALLDGGKAEIVMNIEHVRRGFLLDQFEKCGARQVMICSFPLNDPNHLAGKFTHRVQTKAEAPGMKAYERGICNIVPVVDTNPDENAIYEELKSLQMMQNGLLDEEGDEVS
jgi:hypothetical protein